MTKTIWKFPLPYGGEAIHIPMPLNAEIIHIDLQGLVPCLWAEIPDTGAEEETRMFAIFGTGFEIPSSATHLGTFIQGGFVWHVYEL